MKWHVISKFVVFGLLVGGCASRKNILRYEKAQFQGTSTTTTNTKKAISINDTIWLEKIPTFLTFPHAPERGASSVAQPPAPPGRPPFIVGAAQPRRVAAIRHAIITEAVEDTTTKSVQAAAEASNSQAHGKQKGKKKVSKWHAIFAVIVLGILTLFCWQFRRK